MIDLGQVLDIYDDGGLLLLEKTASDSSAPSFPPQLAELELLSKEKAARLPDNVFAAVLLKEGEEKRKWACHDRGHTALSCLYFLKTAEEFPRWARQKIAGNLLRACKFYGLEPPRELVKRAGKLLLQTDGAEIVVNKKPPKTGPKKTSEILGTASMPLSAMSDGLAEKTSSVIEDPYVDLTGEELEKAAEEYDDEWYALVSEKNGRQFPLVTYAQIKEAADYFRQNVKRFHPRTRREFSTKLAARALAVGIPMTEEVEKYAAEGYAPPGEIRVMLDLRKSYIAPELVGHLDELFEKRADLDPDTFAEVLAHLDIEGRVDRYWDSRVPDPWASTFGVEKRAEWKWTYGNTVVFEDELRELAGPNLQLVRVSFGDDFAEEFEKNPTAIFDSMPLDKKQILARLAKPESRP